MGKKKRQKNRIPFAADSGPIELGASNSSCPGKNSTSNPNFESLRKEKCSEEQQLDIIIRKMLYNLYLEALARLVREGYDEDIALKGLLERGYCVGGEDDCLSNVVQNSLKFLTGKEEDVQSGENRRPQPFKNLKYLVEFNLQFMVYILQKYRPNWNKISIRRRILQSDLDLNRAIIMNISDTPFDIGEMLSHLNLDHEEDDDYGNREKDEFLALEIKEMLDNLNVLDESVSEDMKDAMIAGLKKPIEDLTPQLEGRMRWAFKKLAQVKRKQTSPETTNDFQLFQEFTQSMFVKKQSELLTVANGLGDAHKTVKRLEMEKERIKAEISASKLIASEEKGKKCGKGSKKWRMSRGEKVTMKVLEEMELESKISKLEQELVETEVAIIQAEVEYGEVIKTNEAAIAEIENEYLMAIRCLTNWERENDVRLSSLEELVKELD